MSIPLVVGIDHGLATTGVSIFEEGLPPEVRAISEGSSGTTIEDELDRIHRMARRVIAFATERIRAAEPDAFDAWFVFEGASIGSVNGKPHERAGLWWILASNLHKHGRLMSIPPSTIKKYWTGNGGKTTDKKVMVRFTRLRYPELGIIDHNANDGFVLGHAVARHRGLIVDHRAPAVDDMALRDVRWPTIKEETE